MAAKQHPRLLRSGLTGRVYVVTRYRDLGEGQVEALEKFDVTEDWEALLPAPDSATPKTEPSTAPYSGDLRCVHHGDGSIDTYGPAAGGG